MRKEQPPVSTPLEALLGAFIASIVFGIVILCCLLSIASISIYLKLPDLPGVLVNIGKKISLPRFQLQLSGISNGISSSIQISFPFNFS